MSKAVGNLAKVDYTNLYRYLASTGTIFVSLSYISTSIYFVTILTTDNSVNIPQIIVLLIPLAVGLLLLYIALFGARSLDGWIARQSTMDQKHKAQQDLIEQQVQAYEKKNDPQLPQSISMQDWSNNA
ncbi:hypothetical protein [Halonotius aquaticus]|uniref:hypothetical protein n=1 Tax=Halonotius aquaticus TaxID=2216978 RepID=UPI0010583D13|nr:hypothetical protein [Halonotius aquaticus]